MLVCGLYLEVETPITSTSQMAVQDTNGQSKLQAKVRVKFPPDCRDGTIVSFHLSTHFSCVAVAPEEGHTTEMLHE